MLGFRFTRSYRGLNDQRFWCAELPDGEAPAAGYRLLEAIAYNQGEPRAERHALAEHVPRRRVAPPHQVRAYSSRAAR